MNFVFAFLSQLLPPRREPGVPATPSKQREEMYRLH